MSLRARIAVRLYCGSAASTAACLGLLASTAAVALTISQSAPALPHAIGIGSGVLQIQALVVSWMLQGHLREVAHDIGRLQLPRPYRWLWRAIPCGWIAAMLLPLLEQATFDRRALDTVAIGVAALIGIAGAWAGFRSRESSRRGAAQTQHVAIFGKLSSGTAPHALPPTQVLRWALGGPYLPLTARPALRHGLIFLSVAVLAPTLPYLMNMPRASRSATVLQELMFLLTLLWLWGNCCYRALQLFETQDGTRVELAILPGLGGARRRRQHVYATLLGVPLGRSLLLWLCAAVAIGLGGGKLANLLWMGSAVLLFAAATFNAMFRSELRPRNESIRSRMFSCITGAVGSNLNIVFSNLPDWLRLVFVLFWLMLFLLPAYWTAKRHPPLWADP